jgi:hypothetical protein
MEFFQCIWFTVFQSIGFDTHYLVGYLDMLYYVVLYNLLNMVALGNTHLNEKLVTEIQSKVKPRAKNFTKIRTHM